MTKDQESFFGMALKVKNFGIKKAGEMSTIPAVAAYYALLNTLLVKLITADEGSRADLTGYAITKSKKREQVEALALKVSNALASYALIIGDIVLQKKADIISSKWYSASEEELVTLATVIKNLATPVATNLTDYGATDADVSKLNDTIEAFTRVISDPTLAIDQRKEDNATIVETIDEIRTLLVEKLDVLMRSFEANNASLHDLYKSARAIDINGSVQKPTVEADVNPNSIGVVYSTLVYNPDTFYTIQNKSTSTVSFGLSDTDGGEAFDWIPLNGGETRSRLANNLSATGTFLVVKNENLNKVAIRLWVE